MGGELFVGLMSGTSMDAIDSALLHIENGRSKLLATREHAIPAEIREQVAAISHSGDHEIDRMGGLDRALGYLFADATLTLLQEADVSAARISAIGSHGQTIRHRPASAGTPPRDSFTLQIGDPNTIAEQTGITTVADFRRRDIAAGGEGAPLAPAFHASAFASPGINRAIVNIGGIANVSLLQGLQLQAGFDTGPGNTLLDHWIASHLKQRYDDKGQWASGGAVDQGLLRSLLQHPHFKLSGPRSTGKEAFNLQWLEDCMSTPGDICAQDVQATLAELTANTICAAIAGAPMNIPEVYICGGGAHNDDLMQRLSHSLPGAKIATTTELGIDPDWVEAATFAWLASRTMADLAGNAPAVTGAMGPRILGGIYPSSPINRCSRCR